jgi:hypothetical protein
LTAQQPRRESPSNAAARAARGRFADAQREREHAGRDQQRAADRERRRTLTEQHHGARGREQRPGAARDRIDDREIAGAVAAQQHLEVDDVDHAARHDPRQRRRRRAPAGQRHLAERERRVHARGDRGERERERERAGRGAELLRPQVPARVDRRRREDERERDGGHRRASGAGPLTS